MQREKESVLEKLVIRFSQRFSGTGLIWAGLCWAEGWERESWEAPPDLTQVESGMSPMKYVPTVCRLSFPLGARVWGNGGRDTGGSVR